MFPPNSPHMERIRVKNENDQMNRIAARRRPQKNWTFTIIKRIFNSTRYISRPATTQKQESAHTKTQTGVQRTVQT